MNSDPPPPTFSDAINSCGALLVYALFAAPLLGALFSGSFLGAFMILWIAHLIATVLFPRR